MKILYTFIFLLFRCFQLSAQNTIPCGAQPIGTDECLDACISCTNSQFLNAKASLGVMTPSGTTTAWCDSAGNDQYIGFIAASSTVSITFTNTNCLSGSGLQAAIHGPRCAGTTQGCQTGITPGLSSTITGTGMIIGEIYYLVLNGIAGSQCGIQITSASGVNSPSPNITGISGPITTCPGKEWDYTAVSAGATKFNWRLQTKPIGSKVTFNDSIWPSSPSILTTTDPTIRATFSLPGTYTFCVQGESFCNKSAFRCVTVVVTRPTRPAQTRSLCDNDLFPFDPKFQKIDTISLDPLVIKITYLFEEANGCIGEQGWSFYIQKSTVHPPIDTFICKGESLWFHDDFGLVGPFNLAGNFYVKLERRRPRCDEFFRLDVSIINDSNSIRSTFTSAITCTNKVVPISVSMQPLPPYSNYIFKWSGPEIIGRNDTESILVGKPGAYILKIKVKGTPLDSNYVFPCEQRAVVMVKDDCGVIGQGPKISNDSINGVLDRSLSRIEYISDFFLFPNPVISGTDLNIQYFTEKDITSNVKILGLDGRVFSTRKMEFVHGENMLSIPTQGLASGMYFLNVSTSWERKVLKFIVY
jgi:hypothetical protein